MSRHTITRALAGALVVGALVAPAAIARPADVISPQARDAAATAAAHRAQDLRRLEAGNDLRSPDSADLHRTAPAPAAPAADDGTPWTIIVLGLVGASLLIAVLAVARRTRLRTHVAA